MKKRASHEATELGTLLTNKILCSLGCGNCSKLPPEFWPELFPCWDIFETCCWSCRTWSMSILTSGLFDELELFIWPWFDPELLPWDIPQPGPGWGREPDQVEVHGDHDKKMIRHLKIYIHPAMVCFWADTEHKLLLEDTDIINEQNSLL